MPRSLNSAMLSFVVFNSIGFAINFALAFKVPIDTIATSLFLTGFNLCLLLADAICLYTIFTNFFESIQMKTIEKVNQEALDAHNDGLTSSDDCPVTTPIDSDDESDDEPVIKRSFKLSTSIGVKERDDILSPEECEHLNFNSDDA